MKKKFDEIFASTRYTKALDVLKNIRKEQQVQIRLDEQSLDYLKGERERAHKVCELYLGSCENLFIP